VSPHAADIQDPDGDVVVMTTLFGLHPFLLKLYADRGYQGRKVQKGLRKAVVPQTRLHPPHGQKALFLIIKSPD
jgi:hypothetical protein